MKKYKKLIGVFVFAALIYTVTACSNDPGPGIGKATRENEETPYLGLALKVGDQKVWKRNRDTDTIVTKISLAYLEYNENHVIDVNFPFAYNPLYDPFGPDDPGINPPLISPLAGSGNITDGILTFDMDNPVRNEHLLDWPLFSSYFSRYWKSVSITDNTAMGNMIILYAYPDNSTPIPDGILDRQRIIGTASTIACETILYFYVDRACTITGNPNTGYIHGQYFFETEGSLLLSLEKGWNLVLRKELYSTSGSGDAIIAMEIKNPITTPENYKWVIEPYSILGLD